MAQWVTDEALDAALDNIATSTRMVACSAAPANFAGIAAVAIGEVVIDAGDFAKADGDSSGRKLTIAAQTGGVVDANGTITHIALDDGSELRYVTECASQAVTTSDTIAYDSWKIEIADPTAPGEGMLTIHDAAHAHTADNLALSIPGEGAGPGANEPANFVEFASNDFTVGLEEDGFEQFGNENNIDIGTEDGLPTMIITFPEGFGDGSAPARLVRELTGGPSEVYIRFQLKLEDIWEEHPVGDKNYYLESNDTPPGGDYFVMIENQSGSVMTFVNQNGLENPNPRHYGMNVESLEIVPDTWYDFEYHYIGGDPGTYRLWIDGDLKSDHSDVKMGAGFDAFNFEPIWGGFTPQNVQNAMRMYVRNIYISVPA